MVDESQVVPFEAEDPNMKGISFVAELNETSINSILTKVLRIIKLNKEREIKEKLFKQTIDQLKETFEKNDLDKLKKLYLREKKLFIQQIKKIKKDDLFPKQKKLTLWQKIKILILGT